MIRLGSKQRRSRRIEKARKNAGFFGVSVTASACQKETCRYKRRASTHATKSLCVRSVISLFRCVLQGVFRRNRDGSVILPSLAFPKIVVLVREGRSRTRFPYSTEQGKSRELIPSRIPLRCHLSFSFSGDATFATRFGHWQEGQEIVVTFWGSCGCPKCPR